MPPRLGPRSRRRSMANLLTLLAAAAEQGAFEHGGGAQVDPVAFGFIGPGLWVSLAMAVLILVALWLGVPKMLTSNLDASIAEIRKQLDEAKTLRAEAE